MTTPLCPRCVTKACVEHRHARSQIMPLGLLVAQRIADKGVALVGDGDPLTLGRPIRS